MSLVARMRASSTDSREVPGSAIVSEDAAVVLERDAEDLHARADSNKGMGMKRVCATPAPSLAQLS